jgi:hypothetical protein
MVVGTVSKEIADDIIVGKYDSDKPQRITKYRNQWGGDSYGVVFERENIDKYSVSDFIINPEIIWEKPTKGR